MTQAAGAARVYCGSLLNARRLVEHILQRHARETGADPLFGIGQQLQLRRLLRRRLFYESFL